MNSENSNDVKDRDANRDPITGEPGAHPIGTGVGAAAGATAGIAGAAAAGAAYGTAAGPVGTVAGAAIGGIAGGLAGKAVAEQINPTVEEEYWNENYKNRPYIGQGETYDTYQPAYRYGIDSYSKYEGRNFDEVEPQLRQDWEETGRSTSLTWEKAKQAVRDSYDRLVNRSRSNNPS